MAERFRGHYSNPPETIAGVSAASYHELGRALAGHVVFAISANLDKVTYPEPHMPLPMPRFDADWLVSRIQDEAIRAERMEAAAPLAAGDVAKPERRRRGATRHEPKRLTDRQLLVTQLYGECKGSYAEIARRLGRDRGTVREIHQPR